ncbi:MAG: winged helix-turn-helix transcriptional regulator [Deltaproteobacteria bacterium]|jgi:DNA-binding transcriptional ArsR family regulator|nr:winged helix-turn-helix transcriptional regulator [Deltaproteobacteria bacterium]MBT6338486.1 winged helix-turn-helix transcriptional regulator [Desulfobacula sp.]
MIIDPAEIFKVLSVETRVRIIELLKANGALGVKDISKKLGITPPAVSQHLKILKQAGLVRSERQGYWIPYSINEEAMEDCREILNEVCSCGCKGTGNFKEKELNKASLEALKKYEIELQKELIKVRGRVSEIEAE